MFTTRGQKARVVKLLIVARSLHAQTACGDYDRQVVLDRVKQIRGAAYTCWREWKLDRTNSSDALLDAGLWVCIDAVQAVRIMVDRAYLGRAESEAWRQFFDALFRTRVRIEQMLMRLGFDPDDPPPDPPGHAWSLLRFVDRCLDEGVVAAREDGYRVGWFLHCCQAVCEDAAGSRSGVHNQPSWDCFGAQAALCAHCLRLLELWIATVAPTDRSATPPGYVVRCEDADSDHADGLCLVGWRFGGGVGRWSGFNGTKACSTAARNRGSSRTNIINAVRRKPCVRKEVVVIEPAKEVRVIEPAADMTALCCPRVVCAPRSGQSGVPVIDIARGRLFGSRRSATRARHRDPRARGKFVSAGIRALVHERAGSGLTAIGETASRG